MNMFPETTTKKLQTTKDRPAYRMYKQLGFIDIELQVMETNSILAKLHNENKAGIGRVTKLNGTRALVFA